VKNSLRKVASIEARMGSSRLPGKVLKKFGNETALSLLVKRLKKSKTLDDIVIATTVEKKDDLICDWCKSNQIPFFRGSEEDVLDRVVKAHEFMKSDLVIEITGDCPFTDPAIIDLAVETFLANKVDVVSNCGNTLTWPLGQYAQVFPFELLKNVNEKNNDQSVHEHVSLFFYENPELFKIYELIAPKRWQYPDIRIVLDYEEDFIFLTKIFKHLSKKYDIYFGIEEIIKFLNNNPKYLEINKNMLEKSAR
tara:strand:- start:6897 stop:7649 length:753 start_codon:yes stop_codon:yes gene_type:complete